jgi:hypothetical protein
VRLIEALVDFSGAACKTEAAKRTGCRFSSIFRPKIVSVRLSPLNLPAGNGIGQAGNRLEKDPEGLGE